jgi:hypothetical protein
MDEWESWGDCNVQRRSRRTCRVTSRELLPYVVGNGHGCLSWSLNASAEDLCGLMGLSNRLIN